MSERLRPEMLYLLIGAGLGALVLALTAPFAYLLLRTAEARPEIRAVVTLTPILPPETPTPVFAGGLPLDSVAPARARNEPPPVFPSPAADIVAAWISDGILSFRGPLPEETQIMLYQASLRYIAPTPAESRSVGERINGPGYGSPDLICGPLSLAILQEIGLVTYELAPHDFWLLNPFDASGMELIHIAFPPEAFERLSITKRLDRLDWQANALMPGDFLYIRAGAGGNFDHMLVVNRVDSARRAYAVTNYGTPQGFIINEVMLYDPARPGEGMFYTWTEKPNNPLGATGFDGLILWRRKTTRP